MKKQNLFVIVVILLSCLPLSAKKPLKVKGTPKQCEAPMPALLYSKTDGETLDMFEASGFEDKTPMSLGFNYWYAFSDCNDNVTYVSPGFETPFSSLSFGEKVCIAKIRKRFALVYTPSEEGVYPALPSNVEWKGWIPMNCLVYCKFTRSTSLGQDIRVLLDDHMSGEQRNALEYKLYQSPDSSTEGKSIPDCKNTFYYLIKQKDSMSLLARADTITNSDIIYGWVPTDSTVQWSTRLCLEPTWNPQDVISFAEDGKTCPLISNASSNANGEITFASNREDPYNPDLYRQLRGQWRFPLLNMESQSDSCTIAVPGTSAVLKYPTTAITVTNDNGGDSFGSASEEIEHFNLIFMIDGSKVCEPFFPILASKIRNIQYDYGGKDVSVGAVIYHDSRAGDNMMEKYGLSSPDDMGLYDFIDGGGEYAFKDNLTEAPLISVIDKIVGDFRPDEQNFLIVIGGRGDNSDAELSPSELAERLLSSNVKTFAIHVRNLPAESSYRSYSYLMDDIITSAVSRRFDEQYGASVASRTQAWTNGLSLKTFEAGVSAGEIFDGMCDVASGLMSEEDFSLSLAMVMDKAFEGSSSQSGSVSKDPVFFRKVTAPLTYDGRSVFELSALFLEEELVHIAEVYEKFSLLYSRRDCDREKFYDIMTDYVPSPSSQANIKDYGYKQLLQLFCGVRLSDSYDSGRTIKDIQNVKTVSDGEYIAILKSLASNYARLQRILGSPAVYSSKINGKIYYWVPIEDLM